MLRFFNMLFHLVDVPRLVVYAVTLVMLARLLWWLSGGWPWTSG